jgi:hypothetical protein
MALPFNSFTLNPAQLRNSLIMAAVVVNIWPRGQGKTFDIARQMIEVSHQLPSASSLFVGRTYKKLKRDIIPEITAALSKMGYYPDIHYVLYRRPEKSLQYPNPIQAPGEFDNIITWYTGHTIYLLSQDKDISARGKSVNYVFADELLEINQAKFESEVFPANRGNDEYFKKSALNHGMFLCSSKPIGTVDQWILDYSKYYLEDGCNYTQLLNHLTDLELVFIDSNSKTEREKVWKEIQSLAMKIKWYPSRASKKEDVSIFYNETRFWNNIHNLGWRYIMQQRRTMHDLRFRVEILNHTLDSIENGFYPTFDDKNIYYDSYNYSYIDSLPLSGSEEDCQWDADHDTDKPIILGQDYGVNFNGLTVAQRFGMELRFINCMHVKSPQWTKDVIAKFCKYYEHHRHKVIYYDFDHTGLNRNPNSEKIAIQVMNQLRERGWMVIPRSTSTPVDPSDKYELFHKIYNNNPQNPDPSLIYVTFNGNRCKDLITSIRLSPVKKVARGIAKDKSSETSKVIPQEIATHLSDASDFTVYNESKLTGSTLVNIPSIVFPNR